MPYHRVPDRREKTRQLASPFSCQNSTATPNMWGELPSDQEGSFDRPATPRMSGAIPAERNASDWTVNPYADRSDCSTPNAQVTGINSDGDSIRGRPVEEKHITDPWDTAPHRRVMRRQNAVVGSNGADVSNDWDGTWEECGLSGSKTTGRRKYSVADTRDNNTDTWGNNVGDTRVSCDSSSEQPAIQGNWNRPTYKQETSSHADRRPSSAAGNWRFGSTTSRVSVPVIHSNEGYGPALQDVVSQHREEAKIYNPCAQSDPFGPPERKFGPRLNPDNYDGNRAGPNGSRVFYSAILPTVPTLRDIANHAEYTAWFDMLRSVLKYHQLTAVISPDANRPHGYKDGRRWDQDRLRAAIIIKGALSFEVFERVRRNGWRDTENPTETVEKVRETHGAVCPCGHSQGMTLLDF